MDWQRHCNLQHMPLQQAVSLYLVHLAEVRQLQENSIFHYGHDLNLFVRFLSWKLRTKPGDLLTSAVTTENIMAFLEHQTLLRKNLPSSNRRRLACLRGFQQVLRAQGVLAADDAQLPSLPPTPTVAPAVLSLQQRAALLKAARTVAPNPPRDYAIMLLFLTCGCSLSELLNLHCDDINLTDSTVHFRHETESDRVIRLPQETREALAAYMEVRPASSHKKLFLNRSCRPITKGAVYHAFSRCLAGANLSSQRLTVHTLRHTYIQDLVDSRQHSRHLIRRLSGMRSDAALKPYLQAPDRVAEGERTPHQKPGYMPDAPSSPAPASPQSPQQKSAGNKNNRKPLK